MAGDAIDHFVLAAEAIGRARVDQQFAGIEAFLHLLGIEQARRVERADVTRGASACCGVESTGRPSAVQRAQPPSSTATFSCPSMRIRNQKRAACAPSPSS